MPKTPKYPILKSNFNALFSAETAPEQAKTLSYLILSYIPVLHDNPHPHPTNAKHLVTAAKTILEHSHHLPKNSPKPQDLMIE